METTKSKTNESFKMVGNWETQSNHLRRKFPNLTDSDLKFETGKENELLSRLGTKLNKTREEIISLIEKSQPQHDHQPEKVQVAPAKATHSL